ncbi:MAG TPA: dCMP deaminase family protein [Thermoanaerobaculia bacterium]|nr:dCMP deaminase family protein [Thermoanaerobaculia bacterium]
MKHEDAPRPKEQTSLLEPNANLEPRASLTWDEYFILIALFTSLRSKDPRSKVGAVLVNGRKHIVGTGYNGFVREADETRFTWRSDGDWLDTKYPYVVHAEQNAILNATTSNLDDCVIYTTLFPCNECARIIAQKKIRTVIYLSGKHMDLDSRKATRIIFEASGVTWRQMPLPPFEILAQSVVEKLFP